MRPGRRSRTARAASAAQDHPDLSGGLAVVLAVTTLLELLRRAIGNRADRDITQLWVAGRQLSRNVVGSHLLKETITQSRMLVTELEQHVPEHERSTP